MRWNDMHVACGVRGIASSRLALLPPEADRRNDASDVNEVPPPILRGGQAITTSGMTNQKQKSPTTARRAFIFFVCKLLQLTTGKFCA